MPLRTLTSVALLSVLTACLQQYDGQNQLSPNNGIATSKQQDNHTLQVEQIRQGNDSAGLALLSVAEYQAIKRRRVALPSYEETLYQNNDANQIIQQEIQNLALSQPPSQTKTPPPLFIASNHISNEEEEEEETPPAQASAPPWPSQSELVGGYRGELHCDYCLSLYYTINLYADYSYLLQLHSLLEHSSRQIFSTGLWSHYQNQLRLESDGEAALNFSIEYRHSIDDEKSKLALYLVEPGGLSSDGQRLLRQPPFYAMRGSIIRTGLFVPSGDGSGEFTDCLTDQHYRISGGFDNWRLYKTYQMLQPNRENAILISIRLLFEQHDSAEGNQHSVRAEHLLAVTNSIECPYSIL